MFYISPQLKKLLVYESIYLFLQLFTIFFFEDVVQNLHHSLKFSLTFTTFQSSFHPTRTIPQTNFLLTSHSISTFPLNFAPFPQVFPLRFAPFFKSYHTLTPSHKSYHIHTLLSFSHIFTPISSFPFTITPLHIYIFTWVSPFHFTTSQLLSLGHSHFIRVHIIAVSVVVAEHEVATKH